mmetsp:Transcript_1723/g.10634  ORF Transcript_1723/g.10634 Transcript_1723/m.10634 type:complete len:102 (-) Transcript_1723:857-1162(-)
MADDEDSKEKRKLAAEKRRQKLLERGSNRLAFVTGETKKLEEDQGKPSVKRKKLHGESRSGRSGSVDAGRRTKGNGIRGGRSAGSKNDRNERNEPCSEADR